MTYQPLPDRLCIDTVEQSDNIRQVRDRDPIACRSRHHDRCVVVTYADGSIIHEHGGATS